MKRQFLWVILVVCALFGCTLERPLDIAESCPGATYYAKADGTIDGYFNDANSEYHALFAQSQYCPLQYPICENKKSASFCRELCRANEVFCDNHCITPQDDKTHCGARNLCNDSDAQSVNYVGAICRDDKICRDGVCTCAKSWELTCDGQCIDPTMDRQHCGARGLCTEDDSANTHYRGMQCGEDEICRDGACVCISRLDIRCNGECINPNDDGMHCGARGLCTESDPNSSNYRGKVCQTGELCEDAECRCAKNWEIICNGECIDPSINTTYCGARGLCSDTDTNSVNFAGIHCHEGQNCRNGVCKCAKTREVSCDGLCIDPQSDKHHCGAKALCNDANPDSINYVGGTCDWCEDGVCICDEGKHLYKNTCETDDITHCGNHETTCNKDDFPHSATLECRNSSCAVASCETGAFFDTDGLQCTTCEELIKDVKVGDYIYFGRYRHLAYSEEKQPLEWMVLALDDEKGVLLISRWVLDAKKYNESLRSITWEKSTIRSWLNGLGAEDNLNGIDYSEDNFIANAFNSEELKCIQTVTNENPDDYYYNTEGGENSEDRVFLLTFYEACGINESDLYFGGNDGYFTCLSSTRYPETCATEYANLVKNVKISNESFQNVTVGSTKVAFYSSYWWLRSPGNTASTAACVRAYRDGVDHSGYNVNTATMGVRPSVWLKRSSPGNNE